MGDSAKYIVPALLTAGSTAAIIGSGGAATPAVAGLDSAALGSVGAGTGAAAGLTAGSAAMGGDLLASSAPAFASFGAAPIGAGIGSGGIAAGMGAGSGAMGGLASTGSSIPWGQISNGLNLAGQTGQQMFPHYGPGTPQQIAPAGGIGNLRTIAASYLR